MSTAYPVFFPLDPNNDEGVYLLHFKTKYGHAGHYTGYGKSVSARIQEHREGKGARLTQVIIEAGIEFIVSRVWYGKGRKFERKLKNLHGANRYCPACIGASKAYRRMTG